jgi:hypothetical protein
MKLFETGRQEVTPPEPVGELTVVLEVGVQFEVFRIYLNFNHRDLRRQEISNLLGLQPNKAWNAGERHHIGNGRSGRTRVDEFGLWSYQVEQKNRQDLSQVITEFFESNACSTEAWCKIATAWNGKLWIVGETEGRNREVALSSEALKAIANRGLTFNFDAYFYEK